MPLDFDNLPPDVRKLCQRLAGFYELVKFELLCDQSTAVVRASLEELRAFEKAIKEGTEPKPFRISLNVAQRHSRSLADLIPERRNAQLCFFNDCNNELGEKSPYKDDPVARLHGHLANYEAIEVKPSRRRSARKANPSTQKVAGAKVDANTQTQAKPPVAKPQAATSHDAAPQDAPEDTGVEPSEEVRRLYSEWADAFEEWEKQGDKMAPLPEYPPQLLQGMKELAEKDPAYEKLYTRAVRYISDRERLMKRVNQLTRMQQAHGGAAPATS